MSGSSAHVELGHRTIVESLTERLRQDIRTGVIEPGARIAQLSVAKAYNVSTSPVREAFSALEREGLLVRTPHRGVIVFQPRIEDLVETYTIRIALEQLATETAVPHLTESDLALMERTAHEMVEATAPEAHFTLNQRFHHTIYSAAQSPRLEGLIAGLMADSAAYQRIYGAESSPAASQRINEEHMAIYHACRAGKPKPAGAAMARHLRNSVRAYQDRLRSS
jgi:DNA-binding GntR family transcriptional regulator